jgi:hypothetical protein
MCSGSFFSKQTPPDQLGKPIKTRPVFAYYFTLIIFILFVGLYALEVLLSKGMALYFFNLVIIIAMALFIFVLGFRSFPYGFSIFLIILSIIVLGIIVLGGNLGGDTTEDIILISTVLSPAILSGITLWQLKLRDRR